VRIRPLGLFADFLRDRRPGDLLPVCRLERDQRARQPGLGAIEEQPHAQRFGALNGNQAHVAADVVAIHQLAYLRFIVDGIAFQACDALFDGAAETGADLKAFVGGAIGDHGGFLSGAGLRDFRTPRRKNNSTQASSVSRYCRY